MKLKAFVMIVGLLMASAVRGSAQSFLGRVLQGIEKTNEALEKADKLFNANNSKDQNRGEQPSRRDKPVSGDKIETPHTNLDVQAQAASATASRHPLMDPLLNQAGGFSEVYPRLLCFVSHQPTDWAILGLRGAVKTLHESYANSASATVYDFNAKGFLNSIQQGKKQFVFISKLADPMQRRMYLYESNNNEELTPSDKELQDYVYDQQGRVVKMTPIGMLYHYDEKGLCSRIEYPEAAIDTYDYVVAHITRNEQGDIVNLKMQTTSYEEVYDAEAKKTVRGRQLGAPSVANYPVKYIYDAHGNWTSCECGLMKVKRTITYY